MRPPRPVPLTWDRSTVRSEAAIWTPGEYRWGPAGSAVVAGLSPSPGLSPRGAEAVVAGLSPSPGLSPPGAEAVVAGLSPSPRPSPRGGEGASASTFGASLFGAGAGASAWAVLLPSPAASARRLSAPA